jgi:hypothetical protein
MTLGHLTGTIQGRMYDETVPAAGAKQRPEPQRAVRLGSGAYSTTHRTGQFAYRLRCCA